MSRHFTHRLRRPDCFDTLSQVSFKMRRFMPHRLRSMLAGCGAWSACLGDMARLLVTSVRFSRDDALRHAPIGPALPYRILK